MNSFNHYAYGAIGDWLYQVVAGIEVDPAEPGYKHIRFQPQPGGGLTAVRATLDSPYGPVAASWALRDQDFSLRVSVPPNAHATVRLPAPALAAVTEGGRQVAVGDGILSAQMAGDAALIEVGAGEYDFVTTGLTLAQAMRGVRHVAGRLDRYTSLRDWLAHETARDRITEQLGAEFLQAPGVRWVMDAPLVQLVDFAPHLLSEEKLEALEMEVG
jgi:hypothetical protein